MLEFLVEDVRKFYYGVRYGNIKCGRRPSDDLFVSYFSSSRSVKHLMAKGIKPTKITIHKTFESPKQACDFEVKFLIKLGAKRRSDFLNQVENVHAGIGYAVNAGRVLSEAERSKMSKASKSRQSDPAYKEYRRQLMKAKWQDPAFKLKMKRANSEFWAGDGGAALHKHRIEHPATLGKFHSAETKEHLSNRAKERWSSMPRAEKVVTVAKNETYDCPVCRMICIPASEFNDHIQISHGWSRDEAIGYRYKILLQRQDATQTQSLLLVD